MSSGGFIDLVSAYTMRETGSSKKSARDPTPEELRELLSRRRAQAGRFLKPVDVKPSSKGEGEGEPTRRRDGR